ncbi:MAG TPA: fibronectin type III domain-containing protein [Acidimicrobiales bacterium]|nr:fibronectin type III domain-containing protein [Acidimicrobiales bacterium]
MDHAPETSRPLFSRLRRGLRHKGHAAVVAVVATSVAAALSVSGSANATPALTVSPTTTVFVTPSSSTTLSGLSISGDTTDQLQTTVATNLGTLSITTTTGLTLAYNNSWSGNQSITFTGLESAVDSALATTTLTTASTTGTAQISLTAMVAQSGFNYLASNQHFYEYVACAGCSWTTADAGAQALSFDGQTGYLATIPNATVDTFISTKIANATNVWFGARSYESLATDGSQVNAVQGGVTYARVWRWVVGANESPIAGSVISECTNQTLTCSFANSGSFYSSWASGEPNDSGGSTSVAYQGEYVAVTNWSGTSGSWNDLNPTNDSSVSGYVVEFGGKTNTDASLGTGFAGVVTTTSNVLVAAAATAPGAPTITGTAGDSSADLSWNPPASNGASITSYQVSTDGGSTWNTISTQSSDSIVNGNTVTTVTATVTGLTNGTSYPIKVRAVNSVGAGTPSNTASVTPVAAPGAPTAVFASAGDTSATVSWSPAPANGSTVTGYTVTSSPGGHTCTWTSGPLTCTVTGLANGTPYTFGVTATNGVGTGPASTASTAVTPVAVPGAPTTVTATASDGSASVSFIGPAVDGGSAITSYTVTEYPGGVSISCSSSPCTVTGLTNGTAYTFVVAAANSAGTGSGSIPSSPVTPAGLPGVPTQVTAKAGDTQASVSWVAAASNGSAITSYIVTTSPGGSTTSCSASPCTVSGLTDGTAYTFTVTAINGVGTGPASSASDAVTPVVTELGIALTVTPEGIPQNRSFAVSGSGLEPGSTVTIVVHSSPVTLATVTVGPDGAFTTTVTLPTGLSVGRHTIIASGTSPLGLPVTSSAQFVVPDPSAPAAQAAPSLPTTGFDSGNALALSFIAMLVGLGLIKRGRRRASRA